MAPLKVLTDSESVAQMRNLFLRPDLRAMEQKKLGIPEFSFRQ